MGCNTSKQLEVEVDPKVKTGLPIHKDAADAPDLVGVAPEKEDLPVAVVNSEAVVGGEAVKEVPAATDAPPTAEEKAESPTPVTETLEAT
jgi:hypothetical protein